MHDLTITQFSDFFQAVHGTDTEAKRPFRWQERFAEEVLGNGCWPDVIRVPTGCGKTAVLDLAVFDLAMQASRIPGERTAPRRICLVVDRRLVVDEATDHARRILCTIRNTSRNPQAAPVLKTVTDRLRALATENGEPLRIVRLRGGVYRDDGWASDPLTPTILVSTVDQIGSRLLFRGYGLSRRNQPVHAGLLAFDTRIIVDEAHLSTVFTETLAHIHRYQGFAEESPLPKERQVGIVRMSATVRENEGERTFALSSDERKDAVLRSRLEASKEADLVPVKVDPVTKKMRQEQRDKARERERRNRCELVRKIVGQARRVADANGEQSDELRPRVIGVVVNRVATARQVHTALLQDSGDESSEYDSLLLTGRIRPFDRDRLLKGWLPHIRAGRDQEPERPLFVVATQTVEVGANLDFDALVTEAAPLDALRQRFGRLDRLGRRHERRAPTPASIIVRSDQAGKSEDEAVYGAAIAETWKWLMSVASTVGKGADKRKTTDFGINRFDEMMSRDPPKDIAKVFARTGECPRLFPAHLDAWVQTNPRPDPDPDVAPFLHGRVDAPADVQVVWRADLDPERSSIWAKTVSLMPPLTREALPVPVYEVRAWLKCAAAGSVADVEGAQVETPEGADKPTKERRVLRWRGRGDTEVVVPDNVRPGDTIVVPAKYGGCDTFGWDPLSTDPVDDVANRCLAELVASYPSDAFRRPMLRLRLHPELLPQPDEATHARLRDLLSAVLTVARSKDDDAWPVTRNLLGAIHPHVTDRYLKSAIAALIDQECPVEAYPGGNDGVVIAKSIVLDMEPRLPEDDLGENEPEDDEASFTGREVLLTDHLESVGSVAEQFARGAGLDATLVRALWVAGRWHDEGKRDTRFQAWLRGSELKALAASEPIAKSGRDVTRWKPSILFRYPRGARHEFVSVRLFEQAHVQDDDECNFDLVKFLIGSHHGFGRPFPPVDPDTSPIDVKLMHDGREVVVSSDHRLHLLGSGWVDLFWRMVCRFGWWGLAYLEALLVTADRTVSAREQSRNAISETTKEAAA